MIIVIVMSIVPEIVVCHIESQMLRQRKNFAVAGLTFNQA